MASPIQFIREQIADAAIDPSKIDLSAGAYNFSGGSAVVSVATQSAGDNSIKAASTAYVDAAVVASDIDAGAGILSTGSGPEVFSVDITIGASGLTFSGAGNSGKLLAAIGQSAATRHGLELAGDGYIGILTANANGLEVLAADGSLAVKIGNTSLELVSGGLQAKLQSAFFDVEVGGIGIADNAITPLQIASNAVETAKINDLAVTAGKLAADSVETAKILDANVTTAKIAAANITTALVADNAVTLDKLAMIPAYQEFTGNGSTAVYTLTDGVYAGWELQTQVYQNGQLLSQVTSGTPANDEYKVSGTTLTLGANLANGSTLMVRYFKANS